MGENEKNYLDWEGLLEYHRNLETKINEKANTEDLADVATSGDYNDLDNTPTNVSLFTNDAGYMTSEIDNTNGHDYVEIGGIKWATMNIGAENITDIGLYFQWGDILGYTSEEVGEEKNFTWEDYKFNPSGDGTTFSKYNSTDLKTSLDTEDDAAANAWGSDWRVPTTSELQTLSQAVNISWTDNYQESGVPGLILTDKEDSSKVLFLPATGVCNDGSIIDDDTTGFYWSKSLGNTDDKGLGLGFDKTNGTTWEYSNSRSLGFAIRPVLEGPAKRTIMGVTQAEKDSWNSKVSGVKVGESGEVISPINGVVIIPNQSNVQADWNQNDSSADDFIKNKPGIGVANGLATLDSSGKVPSSQLPSYVDDVIEGYYHDNNFYSTYTESITGGDDAAQAAWGEGWRMPTIAEFQALGSAVNAVWTDNYNSTGVAGIICTDKTDSSKVLFFPAAGYANASTITNAGLYGFCWSSSLYGNNVKYALQLYFAFYGSINWSYYNGRGTGYPVRPILSNGDSTRPYVEIGGVKWSTMNIGASSVTDAGLYFQWGDTQGYTASQVGTDKVFNWVNYKYCNGTDSVMTKYNSTDGLTTLALGTPTSTYSDEITAETGKIYVDIQTNQSYRWSGSTYIVISSPYVLPTASANTLGGVKVGNNLSIDQNGVLSAEVVEYELPTASTNTLGGVKVGDGLSIDNNGVLSALEYESKQASEGGTDVSLVTTGEKYIWNNKSSAVTTETLPVSNGVYAIYADGSLKTAAEADSNALGVAVITDDCCFVIDKTNNTTAAWDSQFSTNGVISGCTGVDSDPQVDFAGVSNTNAIAGIASGGEAAKYCRQYSLTIGGITKQGYLGACGEWYAALLNRADIDTMMTAIGGTAITIGCYWSSTLALGYSTLAWYLVWATGSTTAYNKYDVGRYVRPFYPITKQELNGGTITTNIPTVTIEQSTGSSTTNVMSLNAVTTALTDLNDRIENLEENPYVLPTASANTLGGVKVGSNLSIDQNGVLSAESVEVVLTIGTSTTAVISQKGVTDIITENEEIVSNALTDLNDRVENLEENPYELPIASANTLGGVKIGDGIDITNNAISVKVGTNLSIDSSGNLNATDTTYSDATTSASGLMSAADKEKLNGIGTMGASGSSHSGGLVPDTPSTAGTTKFLCEDGTWKTPAGGGGSYLNEKEEVIAAAINDLNNNKPSNSRVRKTDFSMGDLQAAVEAQSLEMFGLKVGDSKTINGHKYVIAGLNAFKSTTISKAVTALKHVALIVIPGTTQAWNVSGNTYTGANSYKSDSNVAGYLNSDLHYYLVNTVLPLVKTDLGEGNLIYHSKLISNAVNQSGVNRLGETTGCSSGYEWVDQEYISALTEAQVYGSTIWSSSGYDSGEAYRQLDVFKNFGFTEIFGSNDIWLRDIVSATKAAYLDNQGSANNDTASVTKNIAALILFH